MTMKTVIIAILNFEFLLAQLLSVQTPPWLSVIDSPDYDRFSPPRNQTGPCEVLIQIYVESIGNFQVTAMDYDLDIYFIEWWTDKRLRHDSSRSRSINDPWLIRKIWLPDVYFANSKMATYNEVTVPNMALAIMPNGTIRYSVRISLKMMCNMNLRYYPFDKQECHIKILPYGSENSLVNVSWTNVESIKMDPDIMETDLTLYHTEVDYCKGDYYGTNYSCLIGKFYLNRQISLSLIQIYIPTTFVVMISWISFWIDPSSVPGRVGLAVTTLLTLSTHAAAISFQLPAVGYAKALDYWLGTCLLFLFATLIEFTIVNSYCRQWEQELREFKSRNVAVKEVRDFNEIANTVMRETEMEAEILLATSNGRDQELNRNRKLKNTRNLKSPDFNRSRKIALEFDSTSRFLFPLVFTLFAVMYWIFFYFTAH